MHMKIDLHVHTVYSDGSGTVEEVIRRALEKGLDGIAITDHNSIKGYFEAKKILKEKIILIPGFEVKTEKGHILIYGLTEIPEKNISYEELIEWVRKRRGIAILAHPAAGRKYMKTWMRSKPDAVEVLNALYPIGSLMIKMGMKIANKLELPMTGGSDAHQPENVGDAYTLVKVEEKSSEGILEAIKKGLTEPGGGLSPLKIRLKLGLKFILRSLD
ncbi:MAG: hypothetical protein DRJ30_07415 [Candidatus Methanomethylicota archaeon]|nr:MAG: hypothetical protein DRJ30_07415 [Candidatus Verstraetearchaeota archaeon]